MADEEIVDQFDDGTEVDDTESTEEETKESATDKRLRDQEQFIGRQSSEIAELRRIAEERERQLLQYQQTTQYQQPVSPSGDPYEAINQQYWDNPALTTETIVNQRVQLGMQTAIRTMKTAQANVDDAINDLRSDPMFSRAQGELKKYIARIDDSNLVDPVVAREAVETAYGLAVGNVMRKLMKQVQVDPTNRSQMLEALGVASPQSSNGDTASDALTAKDKEMLAAIGITGKKQAEVAKRAAERENE